MAMISVITCSRTQAEADAAEGMWNAALADVPHEVLKLSAPSMCIGYNQAVARAKGDVLIFAHDDIEILGPGGDFSARLLAHLDHVDLVGVAGATYLVGPAWFNAGQLHCYGQVAHGNRQTGAMTLNIFQVPAPRVDGMQVLDGVLIAARRAVLDRVKFDESIPGFHLYDLDFTYSAFRAGFLLGVACDLHLMHWSHGTYNSPQWVVSAKVFMNKHRASLPKLAKDINVPSREQAMQLMRDRLATASTAPQPAALPVASAS